VGRDGQSVVQKVSSVLEAYIRSRTSSMGFAELFQECPVSRASLHRTLSDMVDSGLLAQDGQGEKYRLGPLLRSAAALATAAVNVPGLARPHLEGLRDECGETVVLAELHGRSVVPVLKADGLHEMRMNQEVGRRYPAHAGATGKVLIAQLPSEARAEFVSEDTLERLTSNTVTDRRRLAADLCLVREAGVAVTVGERVPDAVAISAPVFGAEGNAVAALTISGVASRYSRARLTEDALVVTRVAESISADAGFRSSASSALLDRDSAARAALEAMCNAAWEEPAVRGVETIS